MGVMGAVDAGFGGGVLFGMWLWGFLRSSSFHSIGGDFMAVYGTVPCCRDWCFAALIIPIGHDSPSRYYPCVI